MFKNKYKTILSEINSVLADVSEEQIESSTKEILAANKIVVHGAGRVGMAIRGFGMRLGHLGFSAHTLGDSTVPGIKDGDLLVVASGSGETKTVAEIAELAHKNRARLLVFTSRVDSRIARVADCVVRVPAPSKHASGTGVTSVQPMTTLNEQCLAIAFDSIVLLLMEKTKQTADDMWMRHSNLE